MTMDRVRDFLKDKPGNFQVIEIDGDTHTSPLAAQALGVEVAQIAKSLLFIIKGEPFLVVTCGDQRVDSKKLKKAVNKTGKVSMAGPEDTEALTGFPPGGVCPFGLKQDIPVLLDKSLGRFPRVYAAAGTPHSMVPISLEQLQELTKAAAVDVCK